MESLLAPPNAHNQRYLQTKRDRAGHLIPDDDPGPA
jgi:GTP cyclohydrolase II